MNSPSLAVARYYVELFRVGDISAKEMEIAIADAVDQLAKTATASAKQDEEEIRQGVFF